jgi:hypothetical protein
MSTILMQQLEGEMANFLYLKFTLVKMLLKMILARECASLSPTKADLEHTINCKVQNTRTLIMRLAVGAILGGFESFVLAPLVEMQREQLNKRGNL